MRSVTSGRAAKVDGRGPWRLTGSFSNAECWFLTKAPRRSALHEGTPIHCTRDASRDIKPGCRDHLPAANRAATPAERSAAYRARRKVTAAATPTKPPVVVRYRRPADRRSRPERWADAVQTLADMLDQFQEWRDNLPSSLEGSATAEALDVVLELRGHVEDLQAVELPKGFGRD